MLQDDLNKLYQEAGYKRFRMPAFEPYDLYAANRDFVNANQLITFTDLDGTLMALPPDVTLSVLRSGAGIPQRVWYNASVCRPKNGHFCRIPQTGIERIGEPDEDTEAEILTLAARSMACISEAYIIRVSDISFLRTLFASMQLTDPVSQQLLTLLAAKNTAGIAQMESEGTLDKQQAEALCTLAGMYLPGAEGTAFLKQLPAFAPCADILARLESLFTRLQQDGTADCLYLDFSLINSMDYYSGILFQGAVRDIPFPVLNGGRYDLLARKVGGGAGAIGFCVYLDLVENYLPEPCTSAPGKEASV